MSALPYLVMAIVLQFGGHLADWLRSRGILNTTQVYLAYPGSGCDMGELLSLPVTPANTLCNKIQINLLFCGPCIVIYLHIKDQQDALSLLIYFNNLHASNRLSVHHQEVFYCI
jgi:hypothetical protein